MIFHPDVVTHAQSEIACIYRILITSGFIPDDSREQLIAMTKSYSMYGEKDTVDEVFDQSLSEIVSWGIRELDCQLYWAAVTFNFPEVARLINLGANPYAMIPYEKPKAPGEIDEDDITEYFSTTNDICMYWDDVFQPCADLIGDWKSGIEKRIRHTMIHMS